MFFQIYLISSCQIFLAEIEIISNPKSCTVEYGGSCIFSCEARCRGLQLCYEWYKDGRKLQGNIQVPSLSPGGFFMILVRQFGLKKLHQIKLSLKFKFRFILLPVCMYWSQFHFLLIHFLSSFISYIQYVQWIICIRDNSWNLNLKHYKCLCLGHPLT